MPYIGYWQLIKAVDKFIVYDDVSYMNKGWINRNNILVGGQSKLFTLSLDGASQNKLINELEIKDDFVKFRKMLHFNYSKAPHFKQVKLLLDSISEYPDKNLGRFLFNSIQQVCRYLDIQTKICLSSQIPKDTRLKAQEKIIDICIRQDATEYYNVIGGQALYDKGTFDKNNIDLRFIKTELTPYCQYNNEFIGGLSVIDVLMFNSPAEINVMLDNYELI